MNEAQMLGLLRGPTTEEVLKNILITIAGSTTRSGVVPYYMVSFPRNGKESFKIGSNAAAIGAGAQTVNANSIYMVPHADMPPLNQIDGYLLDQNGPDLMLTGMLSGCSFIMKPNADRSTIRCAHLQPPSGAGQGEALNTRCINTAGFKQDPGPVIVFGRTNYPDTQGGRSATVLGVRRGAVWQIFAQQFNANFDILTADQIL
jgi:hypothetical protein